MKPMRSNVLVLRLMLLSLAVVAVAALGTAPAQDDEASGQTGKEVVIKLKKEFITKYKLKATIETEFTVDQVGKVHPAKEDGDLHVSGRAKEVGLPIVAELMNAKERKDAQQALKDAQKNKTAVKVNGAWRLWCEHAGGKPQVQGAELQPFAKSNPDHVFEIHPITKVGDKDVLKSIKVIKGFKPKEAHTAFVHYENVKCQIEPGADTTTIRTVMAGYNHVKFVIEPLEKPADHKVVEDGRFVMCAVRDLEGELVVRKVRMVFLKGTSGEAMIKKLDKEKRRVVLGIPRIDLSLVEWRVKNKANADKPLTWNLPYEMIVVGVYPATETP